MAHKHSVYDTDAHFKIDPLTREITYLGTTKPRLMLGDHNSQRFTFEIPLEVEGHDMSICDKIEIHYTNTDSRTKETSRNVREIKDKQISPESEAVMIFSWLVPGDATRYAGALSFRITFECWTENTLDYSWNTAISSDMTVGSGIDNGEERDVEMSSVVLLPTKLCEENGTYNARETDGADGYKSVTVSVQPPLQEKTITPNTTTQTATPTDGAYGLSKVTVNPINATEKKIDITNETSASFTAPAGEYWSKVTVNVDNSGETPTDYIPRPTRTITIDAAFLAKENGNIVPAEDVAALIINIQTAEGEWGA